MKQVIYFYLKRHHISHSTAASEHRQKVLELCSSTPAMHSQQDLPEPRVMAHECHWKSFHNIFFSIIIYFQSFQVIRKVWNSSVFFGKENWHFHHLRLNPILTLLFTGLNYVCYDRKANAKTSVIICYNKQLASIHSSFVSERYNGYLHDKCFILISFLYCEYHYQI